ncbi:glycosyltransferase family 2 protein [Candidatus Methanosphaera massiliense]|uniref:glycosyltransferase family 2 protein n=1 Tax=Candidatus Methanosphaera massiliense TaxID=3017187 RepID=UPI0038991E92
MLNWNGEEDTVECLESLKRIDYSDYDIYLVDNDSKENSVNYIKNYLEHDDYYSFDIKTKNDLDNYYKPADIDVLFILNDENSGFAGGNNVALNYISEKKISDYIVLLNNDTIVSNDFINGLLDKFNESDDTGFVGINHYYYDNRTTLQTVGGGKVDLVHGEAMAITSKGTVHDFDFITGSCILMSLNILLDVGLMSEDFFMYWEDVDWSTIAREHGYKLRVSDYGYIFHKEGASIKSLSRIYYHTRNRIFYMKRHTTGLKYYKFIIYIILYVLKESVTNMTKNSSYSKTLLKGLKDGLLKN